MPLDIVGLLKDLAQDRPIFHSEADFQHALAWHIHEAISDCRVRLEFKPQFKSCPDKNKSCPGMYLDIWLESMGVAVAVELKYRTHELKCRTQKLVLERTGESFDLRNQAAQPLGRYDFIKDIRRLERVVADGPAETGFAVLLTNDPSYWEEPSQPDTVDAAFRLHERRRIMGKMAWTNRASRGTTKGRKTPICLKGSYDCIWRDYSHPEKEKYGLFRYLMVEVSRKSIA